MVAMRKAFEDRIISRIFATGQRKIHSSSINSLFTVHTTVWCRVTNFGLTDPYIFEDE
jgi:hypothetical protein